MAAFTSKANGDFNADGQTTWNEVGHPTSNADTATIAHAITASAGITCGAVTINSGGSLDTGTAAASITSITTAGTGIATIGSGGCTFAGVLNNGSSATLTINGACTGITTFTAGNCNMNANVSCAAYANTASKTLTLAASTQLKGMTTSFSVTASTTLVLSQGCLVEFNNAAANMYMAGIVTANGTSSSRVTITNIGSGRHVQITHATGSVFKWVDFKGVIDNGAGNATFEDCAFDLNGSTHYININMDVRFNRCFFYNQSADGVPRYWGTNYEGRYRNIVYGYNRAGAADSPVKSYGLVGSRSRIDGYICNATTIAGDYDSWVNNLGRVCSSMLPGTGSALDVANAAATVGAGRFCGTSGQVERSSTNPPTGKTYHARLTPLAAISSSAPNEIEIFVPITTGESITVSAQASRSGTSGTKLTSACADCWIDQEGAWFANTSAVAWDLVKYAGEAGAPTGGYYSLPACAASSAAGGTNAKGMVRVVFRLKEYQVGQFLDLGYIVIQCGNKTYTCDMQNWANGMPMIGAPAASGGGLVGPSALVAA